MSAAGKQELVLGLIWILAGGLGGLSLLSAVWPGKRRKMGKRRLTPGLAGRTAGAVKLRSTFTRDKAYRKLAAKHKRNRQ